MISLSHICKTYLPANVQALQDINLTIKRGEYISIVGASGSGKTTLMQILGCLDFASAGHYYLHGVPVETLSPNALARLRGETIGFIFQSFRLSPDLTALENVALPLLFRNISYAERMQRAKNALESVGLASRMHHRPSALSGGQQQRTAIARAICGHPSLLLADEATGNLDPSATQDILSLFDLLHAAGHTIILITHDVGVAARADRRLKMQDGRISSIS